MTTWIRPIRSVTSANRPLLSSHLAGKDALPLKLNKLVSHWPATSSLSLDHDLSALRELVGEDTAVEVELGRRGRGYLDKGYQRVTMGFGMFRRRNRR